MSEGIKPLDLMSPWVDWDWKKFKLPASTITANSKIVVVDSKKDFPQGYTKGFLHSLDLQVSSSDLQVTSKVSSGIDRSPVDIDGKLSDFLSANFDKRIVLPGDPVVVDRAAEALATPPEFTARVGPSFMLPFKEQFQWIFTNGTGSDMTLYGHEIFFLLFKEK